MKMIWTRKIVYTAIALCCIGVAAGTAVAQDAPPSPPADQTQGPPPIGPGGSGGPGGRGANPERRLEALQRELNLTPDQTVQVRAILVDGRAKLDALRSDTSIPREEKRPQMMALLQTEQVKMKAVLTPDQQKKYDVLEARMRERGQEGRRGGGRGADGPPPPPPPPPQQ